VEANLNYFNTGNTKSISGKTVLAAQLELSLAQLSPSLSSSFVMQLRMFTLGMHGRKFTFSLNG
jgi:hypothetical protein